MKLATFQDEGFFDVLEFQFIDDTKMLRISYRNESHIIHLRKLKINFENLPCELWLLSDQDVMDMFQGKYMAYHCNFFQNLVRLHEMEKVQLPLVGLSLSEIDRCDTEEKSFDDYINSLC